MTFLISEDEALHDMLKGMTVSDDKESARPVGVWFGQPDAELRQQLFPYVTIEMINITEAKERTMVAGATKPWYMEPGAEITEGYDDWSIPMPIPVNLDYQITAFSRQPRHDRQILGQIVGKRLPLRFGSLLCKEVETSEGHWDGTMRRLDVLGMSKRDTVEGGKRMFMNIFTVRVSSEIPTPYLGKLYKRVGTIEVDVGSFDPQTPITSMSTPFPTFKESFTITAPTGTP